MLYAFRVKSFSFVAILCLWWRGAYKTMVDCTIYIDKLHFSRRKRHICTKRLQIGGKLISFDTSIPLLDACFMRVTFFALLSSCATLFHVRPTPASIIWAFFFSRLFFRSLRFLLFEFLNSAFNVALMLIYMLFARRVCVCAQANQTLWIHLMWAINMWMVNKKALRNERGKRD